MRTLAEVLPTIHTQKEPVMVDGVLRRGRTTVYGVKVSTDQMTCQDCGNTEGYTCRDGEHKVWFCASEKCIEIDTEITRERARKERHPKF